jgi:predicted dehydrogenase
LSNSHEKLNAAVIGLGRMGVRHLDAVKKMGMNICGVSDISIDVLEKVRSDYSLTPGSCFTNAEEMLHKIKPEALVISTTAPFHAKLTCIAAEIGVRYILCEKPMATSLVDAELMIKTCTQFGASLAINHQMRFMPHYQYIKEIVGAEELGTVVSILVAGANFGLAMNASHYFEMFRFITDSRVTRINAWLEDKDLPNPRGPNFKDRSGRLLAQNDQGISMYIDFSASAGHGLQIIYNCANGKIFVDELSGKIMTSYRQQQYRELPTSRYGMPENTTSTIVDSSDLAASTVGVWKSLLQDGSFPDGSLGLHVLECLVAAQVSSDRGGIEVSLDSDFTRSTVYPWA